MKQFNQLNYCTRANAKGQSGGLRWKRAITPNALAMALHNAGYDDR